MLRLCFLGRSVQHEPEARTNKKYKYKQLYLATLLDFQS